MTLIENDSPKVQYTGPFVKGQLLPLTFPYIAKTDVHMLIDGVPAELNKEFEIITEVSAEHPVAYPNSAYIKNALPNTKQITLYRVTPLDQQAPFPQGSKFRSERIEQALDKLTMQQQEQEEQLSRCIIAPITLETFNGQLPAPAADQALKWNAEGTELENYDILGEQEAFETEVNTKFEEQSTAFENRIIEFEENTNTQFSEFRTEINENLESVLAAADKLTNLDTQVQVATSAASQAFASEQEATRQADEAKAAAKSAAEDAQSILDQSDNLISMSRSLPMFTPVWTDHIYNDAAFLRADLFSWHGAEVYVTAYHILEDEYNSEEAIPETESGITYKRTPSGFKIALPDQETAISELYLGGHRAWFYILDTENHQFKLPRERNASGKYLYIFVGNYDRPEGEINLGVLTQLATGTKSLEQIIDDVETAVEDTTDKELQKIADAKADALGAIAQTGLDGKVSKIGDTMTGILTIEREGTPKVLCKNLNWDYTSTEAPSENMYLGCLDAYDKNNIFTGSVRTRVNTSGVLQGQMAIARSIDGTVYTATATVGIDTSGNSLFSFPMCKTKATTTSSASNANVAVIVQNYKSGYSWYRVWSDGWIEQGGQNSTASADAKITLLKKFTTTNYYVSLQLVNKRSGSQQNIAPYDKATDSFYRTCNGGTEYNNPIAWYACGY